MVTIYTTCILWFIRSKWLLCFYYIDNEKKLLHFHPMSFSVWCRSKCTIFSLDLLKTYAIFLHGVSIFFDNFLSLNKIHNFHTPWQATFLTMLCFWTSDIIFTSSFQMILCQENDALFLLGGYLHFPGTLYENGWYQLMQSVFLGQKHKKIWESPKLSHTKNPQWQHFAFHIFSRSVQMFLQFKLKN